MSERNLNKPTQYTRKKIENFSYGLNDQIGKGYSSQVYRGRNDDTGNFSIRSFRRTRGCESHRFENAQIIN